MFKYVNASMQRPNGTVQSAHPPVHCARNGKALYYFGCAVLYRRTTFAAAAVQVGQAH